MTVPEELFLEQVQSPAHVVQLYEADEGVLIGNVSRYLRQGLLNGSSLLVVATPEHRAAFRRELDKLGTGSAAALRNGRLVFLDAAETLARFMVDGHPDSERFDHVVGSVVREAVSRAGDGGLRIYGEMVGVLWKAREFPSAIRLEQLWNKLRKSVTFDLFCGYPIDVFDKEFETGVLDALLCAHTHFLPVGLNGDLDSAVSRAMNEILGADGEHVRTPAKATQRSGWVAIPKAEAAILWLRSNLPERADEVLARARQYYRFPS